jgi:hypothetical protein
MKGKYPMKYSAQIERFNQSDAIGRLELFVDAVRKLNKKPGDPIEKSFHLYFNNDMWLIVADSVKEEYGEGKLVKTLYV